MYEVRSKFFDLIFPEEETLEVERPALQRLELLQKDKIPNHVCINMEGNRRWARKKDIPFSEGYEESVKNAIRILKLEVLLGVKVVTIPCFSQANAEKRPPQEIEDLLNILTHYLNEKLELIKPLVCIKTVGDLSILSSDLQESLEHLKKETASSSSFTLVLAINYSGRDEIKRGVTKIARDVEAGILNSEDISVPLIESYLDSANIPDVDLFVQTGGDHSVFAVWREFYTESFFLPMLWQDFREQDFVDVLLEYQAQDRLFGR